MSDHSILKKPLAPQAHSLFSIQIYQKQCEKAAKGKVDLGNVEVIKETEIPGGFKLQYLNPKKDFACVALVDHQNHEMLMRGGALSSGKYKPIAGWQMPDACSVTKAALGTEELHGQVCIDGVVEPKIQKVIQSDSIKKLTQKCAALFDQFGLQHFDKKLGYKVDPKRMHLSSPVGYQYKIVYANQANQFFCEGTIDANMHQMGIRHGRLSQLTSEEAPNQVIEMTDSCSLTRNLMKGNKLGNIPCQDRTKLQRFSEKALTHGFWGVMNGLGLISLYKLGQKVRKFPRVLRITGKISSVASRSFTAIQNSKWVFKLLGPKSIPLIPPYQGPFRTNLVQFIFKNTFLSKLAKVILRGIVVVKVAELSYSWVQSDYEKWVNQRVGDQVFKKEVWAFTKQDRWVIPILFKPFRIGSRFLAKNLWNAAVAQDHQGLKMKIYETDLINSRKKETILKKKLVPLLTLDNFGGLKVPEVLQVLQHPIQKASLPLKKKIAAKFGIGPQDLELAVKEIQQSAKFLYQVGQLRNDWARKVFKKDGTLKGGLEYRDVLQHFSAGMF